MRSRYVPASVALSTVKGDLALELAFAKLARVITGK
jgi:hypothetical protein